MAGIGLCLIKCRKHLPTDFYQPKLEQIVEEIIHRQKRNGSWELTRSDKGKGIAIGVSQGVAGILCFLVAYCQSNNNQQALSALQQGLLWLSRQSKTQKGIYKWATSTRSKSFDNVSCALGNPGVALTFIKAYTLLNESIYKSIAESTLYQLPREPLPDDYMQMSGLSGLGEVYLEADRSFHSVEWGERLNWITQTFVDTFRVSEENCGFWQTDTNNGLSIDLLTGVPGVLHFFLRIRHGHNVGHILFGTE
jgi:hypothetical protein